MLRAFLYLLATLLGFGLAIFRDPFWGLLAYANIYFNAPDPRINWWASFIPIPRLGLVSFAILMISMTIHRRKLSTFRIYSLKWGLGLLVLTYGLAFGSKFPHSQEEFHYAYLMLTYEAIGICIIKVLRNKQDYRLFNLAIILFSSFLSLNAYLYGKRIHARLENIGSADTLGSNEFGLLLAAVIPLTLPFMMKGKKYERAVVALSLPLIINALILCNSRGAMVAFMASALGACFWFGNKRIRKRLFIGLLCLIPAFVYLSDEYFIQRLRSLADLPSNTSNNFPGIETEKSLNEISSGRIEIWKYGIQMAKDHPWGAGPGGFRRLAHLYMPEEILTFHPGQEIGVRAAHNTYLLTVVEQGCIGLALLLLMCGETMFLLHRVKSIYASKNPRDEFWDYHIWGIGTSYLCTLLGGMFTSRLYYEFFWWQTALVVGLFSILVDEHAQGT